MKTILLPTDFSEASENAINFAIEFAKNTDTHILILNTFYVPLPTFAVRGELRNEIYFQEEETSRSKVNNIINKIKKDLATSGKKVICEPINKNGIAQQEIQSIAKERNADLIIMGTNAPGEPLGFIGSTTINIIETIPCPILVVHKNTSVSGLKNIVIAMEAVRNEIFSVIKLVELFKPFAPTFTILHLHQSTESSKQKTYDEIDMETGILVKSIKDYTNYNKIKYKVFSTDDISEGLSKYSAETEVNLMVLLKQQRGWLESLFHKSVTKHLLKNTTLPLLVLPKE